MRAIVVPEFGGPEVLSVREVPAPQPGPGQVTIQVAYAGVNYAETMVRRGGLQKTLKTIAQQRGKSVSQVALNWLLRRDEHVIPIPGVTSARHAQENAQTLTWELSDEEFAAIDRASAPWKR